MGMAAVPLEDDEDASNGRRVDCGLATGYYADANNAANYCFCSGIENVDESGNRVPSRYESCPEGTSFDAGCSGAHEALANGLGYEGGCCRGEEVVNTNVHVKADNFVCEHADGCNDAVCGSMARVPLEDGEEAAHGRKVDCSLEYGYYADPPTAETTASVPVVKTSMP